MSVGVRLLGVGVLGAGLSLQVLAGAGAAWAADDSAPADPGRSASADAPNTAPKPADAPEPQGTGTKDAGDPEKATDASDPEGTKAAEPSADPIESDAPSAPSKSDPTVGPDTESATPSHEPQPSETEDVPQDKSDVDSVAGQDEPAPSGVRQTRTEPAIETHTDAKPAERTEAPTAEPITVSVTEVAPTADTVPAVDTVSKRSAFRSATENSIDENPTTTEASAMLASATVAGSTATGSSTDIITTIIGVVFNLLTGLIQWVAGPPTVPAGSTVTVRTSSLQLTDTLSVPADWYFPEATVPGEAPQRMIYLAHGFFGVGAMYSYTAARLAESTGSIVVVPTVTSNPFAAGGLWINGAALQPVVADLFVGDRSALTASALAAGYAEQYGLDPADADLPRQFALSGHSAGGSLVSGVASYLVANGAVDDLVGVVLFDAVTTGDTVVDAIADLDSTGRFIPVREIGSPFNLWNFPSNVNTALSTARPDSFSGLVLAGGTHADSIQGGSALIQCAVRLLVGTSLPENVAALDELASTWLNAWFDGTDQELVPGSTVTVPPTGAAIVTVPTPAGPATGKVIGATPEVTTSQRRSDLAVAV